jgi:hypothetical protein
MLRDATRESNVSGSRTAARYVLRTSGSSVEAKGFQPQHPVIDVTRPTPVNNLATEKSDKPKIVLARSDPMGMPPSDDRTVLRT